MKANDVIRIGAGAPRGIDRRFVPVEAALLELLGESTIRMRLAGGRSAR